jgi:hypothetical protein
MLGVTSKILCRVATKPHQGLCQDQDDFAQVRREMMQVGFDQHG